MEQNTETKTETKLKPEEMPEYQDKLSQSLIRGWRKQFPEWTDERNWKPCKVYHPAAGRDPC